MIMTMNEPQHQLLNRPYPTTSESSPSLIDRVNNSFRRLSVDHRQQHTHSSSSSAAAAASALCSVNSNDGSADLTRKAQHDMSSSSTPKSKTHRQRSSQYNMADPDDVKRVRAEIKKLLILCLNAQIPHPKVSTSDSSSAHHHQTNTKKVDKMASLLEQHLFQMAPTLGDYMDVRTLQMRLKIALPRVRTLLRTQQRPPQQQQLERNRQRLQQSLENSSAERRFEQVEELVRSIRYERNQLVGASCAQCQFIRRTEGKPELVGAASFGSEFPAAVKQLFFGTALLPVWDKALRQPTNATHTSASSIHWEPLIEQAQANLEAFYEWKAQNFVCSQQQQQQR